MKLGEIRNYIKKRGDAPLSDVAIHFDISKEAAVLALEYWVKKGKVRIQSAACGNSCGESCSSNSSDENYLWVDDASKVHWFTQKH